MNCGLCAQAVQDRSTVRQTVIARTRARRRSDSKGSLWPRHDSRPCRPVWHGHAWPSARRHPEPRRLRQDRGGCAGGRRASDGWREDGAHDGRVPCAARTRGVCCVRLRSHRCSRPLRSTCVLRGPVWCPRTRCSPGGSGEMQIFNVHDVPTRGPARAGDVAVCPSPVIGRYINRQVSNDSRSPGRPREREGEIAAAAAHRGGLVSCGHKVNKRCPTAQVPDVESRRGAGTKDSRCRSSDIVIRDANSRRLCSGQFRPFSA